MTTKNLLQYGLIIFDADGTLRRCTVEGQVCPNRPDQWELLPGVKERLQQIPWGNPAEGKTAFGIASNQAGVAKGYFTEEAARRLLMETVRQAAGFSPRRESVQLCPHGTDDGCECRKPRPHMLHMLMEFWKVSPAATLFVGDMESDLRAAENAACDFTWAREFFDW